MNQCWDDRPHTQFCAWHLSQIALCLEGLQWLQWSVFPACQGLWAGPYIRSITPAIHKMTCFMWMITRHWWENIFHRAAGVQGLRKMLRELRLLRGLQQRAFSWCTKAKWLNMARWHASQFSIVLPLTLMWPQSAGEAWRRSARSAWRSAAAVWSSHLDPTLWWGPGEFQCDLLWPEFLRWVTRRLKRFTRWFGSWFSVAQRIHVFALAPSGNAGEPHWAGRLHPGLPGVDQQKLDSNNKVALVEMWNIVECWGLGSWSLIQFRNIPEMNAYRSIGRGHLANESKPGFCMHRVQFVMKCGSHGPTQQIYRNLTVQVEAKQSFFWGGTLQNNPNGWSEFPAVALLFPVLLRR